MIPQFPNFKKLDISDRTDIERCTSKYLPYSDFNFSNLWSWNPKAKNGRMISQLNNNLVVLFTDYRTQEPSLSFLGTNKTKDTASKLLNYSSKLDARPVLRFITQESATDLTDSGLTVEKDETNFDYIFSVSELANQQGRKLKSKRHLSSRFLREYPTAIFKLMDFKDKSIHSEILSVVKKWENRKISDNKNYELKFEEIALKRLLETSDDHNLNLSGLYIANEMIGFSLDEMLPNKYALSHFIKADTSYKGIYEFLNQNIAKFLLSRGVELWNWEQDLNIEGLKQLKLSYKPVSYLKKYTVQNNSFNNTNT